jgi:hypothetical protein
MFGHLARRDDPTALVREIIEETEFERRHAHLAVVGEHGHAPGVDRQAAEGQGRAGMARRAPDQPAQPRDQLAHRERLGEIIVGAGIDALDLLGPVAARGQHHHRKGAARRAPALQHRQAIEPRQAEIEDHRGIILDIAAKPRILAVAAMIDDETRIAQRLGEVGRDLGIVLDQQ